MEVHRTTVKELINFGTEASPLWLDPTSITAVYPTKSGYTKIHLWGLAYQTWVPVADVIKRFNKAAET